eukprot:6214284-Pleurochrysis_carterae.AAC.3
MGAERVQARVKYAWMMKISQGSSAQGASSPAPSPAGTPPAASHARCVTARTPTPPIAPRSTVPAHAHPKAEFKTSSSDKVDADTALRKVEESVQSLEKICTCASMSSLRDEAPRGTKQNLDRSN